MGTPEFVRVETRYILGERPRRWSARYGAAGSTIELHAGQTISGAAAGAMNRSSAFGSTVVLSTATEIVRPPLGVSNTSRRHRHSGQVMRPLGLGPDRRGAGFL